jgi:hypothetical protein
VTVITTQSELVEAIAMAALARRKHQIALRAATRACMPSWTIRQHQRAVNEADRYLSKLADHLAQLAGDGVIPPAESCSPARA